MPRILATIAVASLAALTVTACGPANDKAPVAATSATTAAPAPATTASAPTSSTTSATATPPRTSTTTTVAPKPKPSQKAEHANAEYFAVLKGVEVDNAGTWWVTYDRAYFCWGEADDDPGCKGPNPITLDDGSWVINNNPELTRSRALPTATLSLYVPGHNKPFTQGLPTGRGQDERGGIHWADTKNKGGIYGVVRYDKTGKVRSIEQYYTP